MFCATCNLHYSEHLNFCRRCGNSLVDSTDAPVTETLCCTRCGARFIRGENFCQQCGLKLNQRSQETVVGGCYGCGTPWRSGWLYCRHCGLDRDQALIGPVSASGAGVSRGIGSELLESESEERIPCPACGGAIKPYSRYCEVCGGSVAPLSVPLDQPKDWPKGWPTGQPASQLSSWIEGTKDGESTETVNEELARSLKGASHQGKPSERVLGKRWSRRTQDAGGEEGGDTPSTPLIHKEARQATPPPEVGRPLLFSRWIWGTLGLVLLGLLAWWYGSSEPRPEAARLETGSVSVPEGMVLIPGGTFQMGREGGDDFERPVRVVTVRPFLLDRTEVTNLAYRQFVVANGEPPPPHWMNGTYPEGEEQFPVVNLTWEEARRFAGWAGKRLPTEAEWEYAARGGDDRLYPWGDEWEPNWANAERGANGQVMAVGSFPAATGRFGLFDMCGNVWEWTADDLSAYDGSGVSLGTGKVIRGGAFDVPRSRATTTYRGVVPAENRYEKTGFRCARDLDKPSTP
jgi:formylglycine-generating enzyme required for sulfatase activity